MSNVTLTIAGRRYTVACAEGEESHIEMLGTSIDSKLTAIPNIAAQSEPRTLLFAALLLADKLHDAEKKAPQASQSSDTDDDAAAEPLEKLAERLESLASHLEDGAGTS